jgi:hypothetical protein
MQAHSSLSSASPLHPEQRAALECLFLVLRTARLCLDNTCGSQQLDPLQRIELQSLVRLISLNESRLVDRFPEITTFARQWDGEVPS